MLTGCLTGVGAEVRVGRWRRGRRRGRGGCGGRRVLGEPVLKIVVVPQLQFLVVVVQFLDRLLTCPLLCYDSVWVDCAENCGVPQLHLSLFFVARPVTCPCCASREYASVHGCFWMNFLGFLRECRLRS